MIRQFMTAEAVCDNCAETAPAVPDLGGWDIPSWWGHSNGKDHCPQCITLKGRT